MLSPSKFLLCSLGLLILLPRGRAEVGPGDVFPALSLAGPVDRELPATTSKVVLVDFWASWCAPCRASFTALARLHEEFGSEGLVIVAVSVDEKPAAYANFVKLRHPPFATVHDRDQKLVGAVKVPAMPTTYVLDRQGRVRFLHQGFHGKDSEAQMRREIAELLAEKV